MVVDLFNIVAMHVRWIIGLDTTANVKKGPLNCVTKSYSNNQKTPISVTAQFVSCRSRLICDEIPYDGMLQQNGSVVDVIMPIPLVRWSKRLNTNDHSVDIQCLNRRKRPIGIE